MDHHSTEMDASAAAMQGLYQHVKAVYRSVKDANARVESAVAFTPLPIHDSTPPHQPSSANTTPRGRVVAPLSVAERRPWGYHSPARQPSPQRESSPKTMPRNVAAAKSPSPNRSPTPNAEKPALPLAPRAPSPASKRLEITPTATPIRGSSPSSVRAARGSPAAQPRRTTAAAVDVHAERFTALEAKIDELSIVLESERQQRQVLEAELAVLRAQQAQNTELRRQVEEQRESMMALSSQVQFALAWIQQVDRHIAQEDEQRGGAASAHQSQTSIGSSPSQSRHQLSSEHHHHPHHAGDVSTVSSAYRLPPSQPVALVHP